MSSSNLPVSNRRFAINKTTVIAIIFGLALFTATVVATYAAFTSRYPGHNDFLSRWEGARSYWVDGLNPYGDEASFNIQMIIYGHEAQPGEDLGLFVYPFYTVFLVWPLVYLPYAWAAAICMVVLEVCLLGAGFLLIQMFKWRPATWLLPFLMVWLLLFYPAMRGLLLGQLGLLVYALEILTLWALAKDHDRIAGVALAISTFKPQMGYLIVPFLLLWALRYRRWEFVRAFVIAFGILLAASFLLVPSWFGDWVKQVTQYPEYTQLGSPVWIVSHWGELGIDPATGLWGLRRQGIGDVLEVILIASCYLLVLWAWVEVLLRKKTERLMWTIALTLVITHLVAPRTASPHFVTFILPLVFLAKVATEKNRRRGNRYVGLALLTLFILPWVHFFYTVVGEFEHPTVQVPLPFLFLAIMLFTYRLWWERPSLIQSEVVGSHAI